ncbi:hypothetical protein [Deinococcus sp. QL22]|uniref:RCC1 domain-containing protein n=1 Tax=Deinococcus sp. QL22 TaxID=2939437 RepID=UPI002016FD33|nr:hypothetical protein [Deinococcus sp. QL22]UQN09255.1 hypothetical protein M1R55_22010 [Deinococcus sp. QL22]
MTSFRFLLLSSVLALTACGAPPTSLPQASTPGLFELEFSEGDSLTATAVPGLLGQALTDQNCVVLGSKLTKSAADYGTKRYIQTIYPLTNNCTMDLQNLTFVAVYRQGTTPTIGGTSITSMTTFGGTPAASSLAPQILPTQPFYISGTKLVLDQNIANLQVFDDTPGGELDSLERQVQLDDATYDLLPYGFVSTSSTGSRTIPAGETGQVTFALSFPIQPTKEQDVFRFKLLMTAATNSITSVTQSLTEQDAAGKAAVEARAAKIPGARIRTLLGPDLTPSAVAKDSLVVCRVRTAGSRETPTATLVNTPGTLALTMNVPTVPLVLGGAQPQPSVIFTVNGIAFPTRANYNSLTPGVLSVTRDLVRPVASIPLARQTGTVQGRVCGVTATASLRTSPYTSLSAGPYNSLVVKPDGTVAAWGLNDRGQSTVPAGLTGVVAVSAGGYHSLALRQDGTVVSWGNNMLGTSGTVPAGLSGVVTISAGGDHSLALKQDGTVVAWGENYVGQSTVPAGLSEVVAIAAGQFYSLALKADGNVVAWKQSDFGAPNVPLDLTRVSGIAAGSGFGMATKEDGTVVVWGAENDSALLGVPPGLSGVVAVSGNKVSADDPSGRTRGVIMALKADGSLVIWGNGGRPWNADNMVAVSVGTKHFMALKPDGALWVWGGDDEYDPYQTDYGQGRLPDGVTAAAVP